MGLKDLPARAFDQLERDPKLAWAFAAAFGIRLLLIPFFSDPLNFYGVHLTSSFAESGYNPWVVIAADPAVARLNPWGYPPLFLLPVMVASALSLGNGFVFGVLLRLPLVLADMLTALFVLKTCRSSGMPLDRARPAACAYLFNPFVILISAVWGTNDPVPVLFVAAAVYYLLRPAPRHDLSALLLGTAIAFKIYPLVLIPVALASLGGWKGRLRYIVLAALPGALTVGPVLLSSPRELLSTLGAFTTGMGAGGLDLNLSVWWVIADSGIPVYPVYLQAGIVLYLSATVLLGALVALKKLSFIRAATVILIGLFLVSPRYNHNYFLWAMYFIILAFFIEPWRTVGRAAGSMASAPLTLHALIYNGIGPVVNGITYWSLISMGLFLKPDKWAGPVVRRGLVALYLVLLAAGGLTLFLGSSMKPKDGKPRPGKRRLPTLRLPSPPVRRSVHLLLGSGAAFLVLSSALGASHFPVTPETFGHYSFTGARIVDHQDFRGALLEFTWDYSPIGIFKFDPSGAGTLEVDTQNVGWIAFIERAVPNAPFHLVVRGTLESIYGDPGFIQLLRVPAGWVGVVEGSGSERGSYILVFFDEVGGRRIGLAPFFLLEPFEVTIDATPDSTQVQFKGATLLASGKTPISKVQIGHVDVAALGGGRIALDWIDLSWPSPLPPPSWGILAVLLVNSSVVLVAPVYWWRARKT